MRPLLSEQGWAELAEEVPTAKGDDLSDRSSVLKLGDDLPGPASSVDGVSTDRRERKKSKESCWVSRSVGGLLNKRVLQSASDKISRVRKQMAGPSGRAADTTRPP